MDNINIIVDVINGKTEYKFNDLLKYFNVLVKSNSNSELVSKILDKILKQISLFENGKIEEEYEFAKYEDESYLYFYKMHKLLTKSKITNKNVLIEKILVFITKTFTGDNNYGLIDYLSELSYFIDNSKEPQKILCLMINDVINMIYSNIDKIIKFYRFKLKSNSYYFSGSLALSIFDIAIRNEFENKIIDLIKKDTSMISGRATYSLFEIFDKEKLNVNNKKFLLSEMLDIFQDKLNDYKSTFSYERLMYIFDLLIKYNVDPSKISSLKNTILSSVVIPKQTKYKIEKSIQY